MRFDRFQASSVTDMKKYIGWIVFGTLFFYLLSVAMPFFLPVATVLAWLCPFLTRENLTGNALAQALVLLLAGAGAILFSASHGVFLGWGRIFSINVPLLAMFVAVSFLCLTNPVDKEDDLPKGNSAAVLTGVGLHLLGAIINLSALFIFGDRLRKKEALSREQMVILSRSFTAAAWWSPFFIATGVAFTYAPGMQWKETLLPGVIMSGIGLCFSIGEVCLFSKKKFSGYPLKKESLAVPLFLAAMVIFIHLAWSKAPVLPLICLLAPAGTLLFMKNSPRIPAVRNFIDNSISSVTGPFALFLAAGVFSCGIKSLMLVFPSLFSLTSATLSPELFATFLGIMILAGIIGIHPVVTIAIASPLLLPLNPDHSQLGFLFLSSWAVSTCSSPLSGVGLVLVSRFAISPGAIIKSNLPYAIAMWAIATLTNNLFFPV
ncbi:hypothetical protein SAMN05660330_02357 [Desulforhopalus singaporensis]|uniref:Di-and tricarboxylate transporter n=2 Tax=Desulforhopalus singaporensis TaxID=91360 RepID=A0A1H0RLJ0_9BACT|nr:hypothetical protein SAMN05660330_02357 [Desulforhopalus singaporensis]